MCAYFEWFCNYCYGNNLESIGLLVIGLSTMMASVVWGHMTNTRPLTSLQAFAL
jgi:hypothetical protein